MTKEEENIKKNIETKIKEVRQNIKDGKTEISSAYAYMYGYVSQALKYFIGHFDNELTGGK